jgi:hypothetical protein
VVHMWLCMQPKSFFANFVGKLVDQSNNSVEKIGDYVKK